MHDNQKLKNVMAEKDEKAEHFSVNLFGLLKFDFTNPGKKTLFLLIMILIFFLVLVTIA
jgi:hypothetical protein